VCVWLCVLLQQSLLFDYCQCLGHHVFLPPPPWTSSPMYCAHMSHSQYLYLSCSTLSISTGAFFPSLSPLPPSVECARVCVCMRVRAFASVCMRESVCKCVLMCMYTHAHMYMYIYTCKHMYTHIYMLVYIDTFMY